MCVRCTRVFVWMVSYMCVYVIHICMFAWGMCTLSCVYVRGVYGYVCAYVTYA